MRVAAWRTVAETQPAENHRGQISFREHAFGGAETDSAPPQSHLLPSCHPGEGKVVPQPAKHSRVAAVGQLRDRATFLPETRPESQKRDTMPTHLILNNCNAN